MKKGKIIAICNSCGKISGLDSVSKFGNYILKNPPKNETEFASIKAMFAKKRKEQEKTAIRIPTKPCRKTKGPVEELKHPEEPLTVGSQEVAETISRIRKYKDTYKPSASELANEILTVCVSQGLKHDLQYYATIHGLYNDKFLYQWVIFNITLS